jgi:protein-tyrosine phosphatase
VTLWLGERSWHGGVDEIPLPLDAGRLWLCGKRFVAPDPDGALERVGADRIVCLCEAQELAERYPDYVAWLRARSDAEAIWFPIPDLHAPGLDATLTFSEQLRVRLTAGDGILMHCGAGMGRAGTMAAALLMTLGAEISEAVATIGRHRPLAGPESGAQSELLAALAHMEL